MQPMSRGLCANSCGARGPANLDGAERGSALNGAWLDLARAVLLRPQSGESGRFQHVATGPPPPKVTARKAATTAKMRRAWAGRADGDGREGRRPTVRPIRGAGGLFRIRTGCRSADALNLGGGCVRRWVPLRPFRGAASPWEAWRRHNRVARTASGAIVNACQPPPRGQTVS